MDQLIPGERMRFGDRLLRDMDARFGEIGRRFDLLAWVDRAIIHENLSIETAISEILKRSTTIFGAKAASAFAIIENIIHPFPQPDQFSAITLEASLSAQIVACKKVHEHGACNEELIWLLLPIFIERIPSLKIVFVYESPSYGDKTSFFHDPNLHEFTKMLVDQCHIVISKRIGIDLESARTGIMDTFFREKLENEHCWLELARQFADFLPNWTPLKIEPKPQVQFLTYDGNKETIVLRAGTNQTLPQPAKALLVEETICGIVIQNEIEKKVVGEHLYVDPIDVEYRNRFRSYLQAGVPRSELVIPIRWVGPDGARQTIGLVNLEHGKEAVFSKCHIEMLRIGAEFVAPFVVALLQAEQDQRTRHTSHLYMMHNILTKMARTYRHKVGQYIAAATLSLEALEGVGPRLDDEEKKFFDRLQRSVSSFAELSKNFLIGLPNYVQFGPTLLLPLIETAVGECNPEEMKRAQDIELKLMVEAPPDLQVFGSPLLAEHVYNLLINSIDSVRERLRRGEITKGMISVTMKVVPQTDRHKKEGSFPLVMLDIEDNGGGLSLEAEANWGRPRYTTKEGRGGSGFGVPSAIEYLTALGGKLEHKNGHPHKLNVLLYLPTYVQEIHGPTSYRLNFGRSDGKGDSR